MTGSAAPDGVRTLRAALAQPVADEPSPHELDAPAPPSLAGPPGLAAQSTVDDAAAASTGDGAVAVAAVAAPIAAGADVAPARPDLPPATPPQGTVYQSRRAAATALATGRRRGFGLPRLRIGAHAATTDSVRTFDTVVPGASGLLLGVDRDRLPVPVPLFGRRPTRVAIVADDWPVRVLVFRALAIGVRVAVVTPAPAPWSGFGEWATGQPDRLAVFTPGGELSAASTAAEPVLVIHDVRPLDAAPALRAVPGPWQAHLVVLRGLTGYALPVLSEADVVLLRRLTGPESDLAARALRLSPEQARRLRDLEPEVLGLFGEATPRYVWLRPTPIERAHLGIPAGPQ